VQRSPLLLKSPTDQHKGLSWSTMWPSYQSNTLAFWMHLPNWGCTQAYLRMLLEHWRILFLAPGRLRSVWNTIGALVQSTGVSRGFGCGIWKVLHCANVLNWSQMRRNKTNHHPDMPKELHSKGRLLLLPKDQHGDLRAMVFTNTGHHNKVERNTGSPTTSSLSPWCIPNGILRDYETITKWHIPLDATSGNLWAIEC